MDFNGVNALLPAGGVLVWVEGDRRWEWSFRALLGHGWGKDRQGAGEVPAVRGGPAMRHFALV